jgi:hypothetical protein
MTENQMKRLYATGLVLILGLTAQSEVTPAPRHVNLASTNTNTREIFQQSMGLDAQLWDNNVKLVHRPGFRSDVLHEGSYMVRESSWYALGLLLRDAPGDRQRAADILDAVLKQQYVTPGVKWYGTYKRTPEEPNPSINPVMWEGYDPNWRHFIGTTFAMILIEYPDRISPNLSKRMYEAIDRAIDGEMKEGRLVPSYSNIALMYGFLWDFAAVHDNRDDWKKQSSDWNEAVYSLFKKYDAFFEYNSPTYYGVDLYGLALWRDYGSTPRIQKIGSEMEATLWNDIASFYNPLLRNISGPYDRSYGMDMESYVAIIGVWMRTVLDAKMAPLPRITATTDHVADVWFAPHLTILGTRIPPEALAKMKKFDGDHLVHKQITEQRGATAWIGRDVIFGGETTGKTKDAGTTTQFHPVTVQWRTPSGEIGWVRLAQSPMIDVTANQLGLTISASGTLRFRIHAMQMAPETVTEKQWALPGLNIAVISDAKSFRIEKAGNATELTYTGMTQMKLAITKAKMIVRHVTP